MKFCTVIRGPKSKIEFVWDKDLITPSLFYPKFLKIYIIIIIIIIIIRTFI